ncbi:MAG TPA: S49 family peptidase [Hyphomicrobiales bacterium]|nr:S49 family peptidase [Hyphomicrobiales bacterium]
MQRLGLPHIASRVLNTPLLLEPAYAATFFSALAKRLGIVQLLGADGEIDVGKKLQIAAEAFQTAGAERKYRPYTVQQGVAVLPVTGTLVHRYGYLQPYSGMTGYDGIVARHKAACDDPEVKGVLLDFDTPGGEVSGCFDATRQLARIAADSGKPLWAVCNEMHCSAGMALASAAERRLITQTAMAGSVGVVMAHASWQGALEEAGIIVTLIHSGARKVDGNPYENLDEGVMQRFQAETDGLRQDFAALVSELIGMDLQAVLDTEAAVYRGQAAIDIGFAHELVNGNEAVAIFAEHLRSNNTMTTGGNTTMTEPTTGGITAALDTTASEGELATVRSEASKAERARVQAILGSDEAKGKGKLAEHLAFQTSMTADEAKAMLSMAAEEASANALSPLSQAMQQAGTPGVTANQQGDPASPQTKAASILASYNKATGAGK